MVISTIQHKTILEDVWSFLGIDNTWAIYCANSRDLELGVRIIRFIHDKIFLHNRIFPKCIFFLQDGIISGGKSKSSLDIKITENHSYITKSFESRLFVVFVLSSLIFAMFFLSLETFCPLPFAKKLALI